MHKESVKESSVDSVVFPPPPATTQKSSRATMCAPSHGKSFLQAHLPRDIIKTRQERSRSITRQKSHEWQLVAFLFPWCRQGLTPRLIAKYSSVEPFANVVGDYACHNREKKQRSGFHYTTPPSVPVWGWQHENYSITGSACQFLTPFPLVAMIGLATRGEGIFYE